MKITSTRLVKVGGPPLLLGSALLLLIVIIALLGPFAYPGSPFSIAGAPLLPPGDLFPLGTDVLGRDIAVGIVHGARASLFVGVVATVVALIIGTGVGAIAGYAGGVVDATLMRATEVFQTIPAFVFAILILAILGPAIENVVVTIAIVSWPPVARLVRAEFLSLKNREFVLAATGLGFSRSHVIFKEILPNCISPIIVMGSLMVATAILIESGLSFLGLSDPNVMSWGYMIGAGRTVLRSAWWVCTIPGIAVALSVLAINLVGQGINDVLNPRLRA
uniref:ABC transporter permease n=1 Tax=Ensifer adhaerens TaxID=106592 RepID=UPI003F490F42